MREREKQSESRSSLVLVCSQCCSRVITELIFMQYLKRVSSALPTPLINEKPGVLNG